MMASSRQQPESQLDAVVPRRQESHIWREMLRRRVVVVYLKRGSGNIVNMFFGSDVEFILRHVGQTSVLLYFWVPFGCHVGVFGLILWTFGIHVGPFCSVRHRFLTDF